MREQRRENLQHNHLKPSASAGRGLRGQEREIIKRHNTGPGIPAEKEKRETHDIDEIKLYMHMEGKECRERRGVLQLYIF